MKNLITTLLLAAIIIPSCSENDNQSQNKKELENSSNSSKVGHLSKDLQELHSNIIAIHDSVMPKINVIRSYRIEVEQLLQDSTNNLGLLNELNNKLHVADSSMLQWMRNHHEIHFNYDDKKNREILEEQLSQIIIVRDRMNGSISEAKKLLKVN